MWFHKKCLKRGVAFCDFLEIKKKGVFFKFDQKKKKSLKISMDNPGGGHMAWEWAHEKVWKIIVFPEGK
jgi:hypothetical protein